MSAQLTDAIKKKSGFAIIFVRSVQNLDSDEYTLTGEPKKYENTAILADFDPSLWTLFFGIFVGHAETRFNARGSDVVVNRFRFGEIQIIILTSFVFMPSHFTSQFAHAVTLPPSTPTEGFSQEAIRSKAASKSGRSGTGADMANSPKSCLPR